MNTKKYSAITFVALLLLSGFLYMQLEGQMANVNTTVKDSPITDIHLKTQIAQTPSGVAVDCVLCDNLNAQLVSAQGELKKIRDKLNLANSKVRIAKDEMTRIADARNELKQLKENLLNAQQELERTSDDLTKTTRDYKLLAELFTQQNKMIAEQTTQNISKLRSVVSGVSITATVSPFIAIAKLIEHGEAQINNYCADIQEVVALEKIAFGTNTSLTKEAFEQYISTCNKGDILDGQTMQSSK